MLVRISAAVSICWALSIAGACAEPPTIKIDFVQDGIGTPPANFDFSQTGGGPPGQWTVVRDATAVQGAAIEQFSRETKDGRLPLAIYRPASLKNVVAAVRFKILEGRMQTAGIAVRVANADTYYVAVANALEGRVDLFRFINGRRTRIAGVDAEVARTRWQTLQIVANENRFTVSLDGTRLFSAWDDGFMKDGHVALWTEEDNATRFDEIVITPFTYPEAR